MHPSIGGVAVVLLLPTYCFVVGLSAGFAGREQFLRGAPLFRGPHLLGVLIYTGLVVAPLWIYLAVWHPAWSFLYWIPSVEVRVWQIGLIFLTLPAAGLAGFLMTAFLASDLRPYAAITGTAFGGAFFFVLLVACMPRLGRMTDQTHWQEAGNLPGSLIAILAFALPMLIGGFAFLLVLYEVEGRKLRRSSEMRLLVLQQTAYTPPSQRLSPRVGPASPGDFETRASPEPAFDFQSAKTASSPLQSGERTPNSSKDPT